MKIATWNVERLKHQKDLDKIMLACEQLQADILVLTETDHRIHPSFKYCIHTPPPAEIQPGHYKDTENRISIYTNYKCVQQHTTYDRYTALCVELETERGNLLVYGTIIGIYGNRHKSFQQDLLKQVDDFRRLSAGQHSLCICGDFNCSFSDNYYFTSWGRNTILQSLEANHIELLTKGACECIDHLAVSEHFTSGSTVHVTEWNSDKRLSDHKGILVDIV